MNFEIIRITPEFGSCAEEQFEVVKDCKDIKDLMSKHPYSTKWYNFTAVNTENNTATFKRTDKLRYESDWFEVYPVDD